MSHRLSLPRPAYLVPLMLASGALFQFATFWRGVGRARALAAGGKRFERLSNGAPTAILILGDSTGVGVGAARPEDSMAGLIAADFPDAEIVNLSMSGARVCDTVAQAKACAARGRPFDLALLHVGANDIVRATPPALLADACDELLGELPRLARRTVWLGPPNLGLAPLFPRPYSWVVAARSRAAAAVFTRCAVRHAVPFIDFCKPEHDLRFGKQRHQHFASDGFHPNSASYKYGYAAARESIRSLAAEQARVGALEAAA